MLWGVVFAVVLERLVVSRQGRGTVMEGPDE
jgi:hypothetical protein